MKMWREDFNIRSQETAAYIRMLREIEERPQIQKRLVRRSVTGKGVSVFEVMKAGTFLLLYNLIESTVRQRLKEIVRALHANNLCYTDASEQVRKLWLEQRMLHLQGAGAERVTELIHIAFDTVVFKKNLGFEENQFNQLSGNLDARKIREYALQFGFAIPQSSISKDGERLRDIKDKRNSLSHGIYSFEYVGRDCTAKDLQIVFVQTFHYLRAVNRAVDAYLSSKQYQTTSI